MLTEVGSVAVLVTDANKAAEWDRQKLGAEVTVQGQWVAAKLPRSNVVIHLCGKNEDWEDDRSSIASVDGRLSDRHEGRE